MGKLVLAEQATPGTPASGQSALYPKTDGLWYFKDDAGVEHPLSMAAGSVINSAYTLLATRTAGTAVIPSDNTIPQSSEGTELITASITPRFASSLLRVRFSGYMTNQTGTANTPIVALFRDSGANALYAAYGSSANNTWAQQFAMEFTTAAGSISATTFKIRFGPGTAGGSGFAFNGGASANQFGGVDYCSLTIEEIKQ